MSADILQLAVPGVQALQPYAPGKPLSELEREYGIRSAIKLASNENPLGPGRTVIEALRSGFDELARYPDGNGYRLKSALAGKLSVSVESITLGNGSNDVLELVARAFLSPQTSAVFSQHAFAVYPLVTQAIGAQSRVVAAHDGSRGPAFGHDLDAMLRAVAENTRVVFIANPNNPTGTWVSAAELRKFLECMSASVIVVVDEAYFEYVNEPDYPNAMQWVEEFPNLLVTRTFSKAYGLASLRVGYGVSQPELADLLNRVRQPFNVNSLAQLAAVAALVDDEHLQKSIRVNQQGMAQLTQGFESLGLAFVPSVGNFIALQIGENASAVYEGLLREGVIVRPVDNYAMPGYLRISIGLAEENNRLLRALGKVIRL